jgi:hypothetical protein
MLSHERQGNLKMYTTRWKKLSEKRLHAAILIL